MGAFEPDTAQDYAGGWMFRASDVSPDQNVRRVYFNGFYGQCVGIVCTNVNPNVAGKDGLVRSSIHSSEYKQLAMLGVWKDCNMDGYVGYGEQGLLEYRYELLLDTSACPKPAPGAIPNDPRTNKPPVDWFPLHNDGNWVHELLPIAWNDVESADGDHNAFNVNDNGARVWADHGLEPAYGLSCYYTSWPVGTFRSTGGLLHTMDCADSYRVTDAFDLVVEQNGTTAPLSFSDASRDQARSASPLNARNPWGDEGDASDAQVWDCQQPTVHVVSVKNAQEYNVSKPLVPPSLRSGGSAAGTMNATGSGFDQCQRSQASNGHNHVGNDLAGLAYPESATSESPVRTQPDDAMRPMEATRPNAPLGAVPGFGKWGPGNLGVNIAQTGPLGDTLWRGNRAWHQETVLTSPSGVAPVKYETYYAFVSPNAISKYGLSMPKGAAATGTYGIEACSGLSIGIYHGWDCDPAHWYKDARGADVRPRSHDLGPDPNAPSGTFCIEYSQDVDIDAGCLSYGALPGDFYNLRDIDCYDDSVALARPIGWGTLTGTSCAESPP